MDTLSRGCALAVTLFLLCAPALADDGNWRGGSVMERWFYWLAQPVQPMRGSYRSADVMAVYRAECIAKESTWLFHAARDRAGARAEPGNQVIRGALAARFPRLGAWFWTEVYGADKTFVLKGAELKKFGVKQCRDWSYRVSEPLNSAGLILQQREAK